MGATSGVIHASIAPEHKVAASVNPALVGNHTASRINCSQGTEKLCRETSLLLMSRINLHYLFHSEIRHQSQINCGFLPLQPEPGAHPGLGAPTLRIISCNLLGADHVTTRPHDHVTTRPRDYVTGSELFQQQKPWLQPIMHRECVSFGSFCLSLGVQVVWTSLCTTCPQDVHDRKQTRRASCGRKRGRWKRVGLYQTNLRSYCFRCGCSSPLVVR